MKMTQDEKHFLNLAGEFLVAGELNRRRIMCSVTYGFSKQADVIAMGMKSRHAVWIEVKTTRKEQFILGAKALDKKYVSPDKLWVLVHLPEDEGQPPRYFVLSSKELHKRAMRRFRIYNAKYRKKHGHDYDKPGLPKLSLEEVENCESQWGEIAGAVE
jgi:hypothetical protein